MVESRASPQGLLVFPPGAAEQNWRPCHRWSMRAQLSLCGAWPGCVWALRLPGHIHPRALQPSALVPCPLGWPRSWHWTVATHSTGELPTPSHPWPGGGCSGERCADTATCSRRMCVTTGLSPVPLCPVCTQMSTNAARRTEDAIKYATTSQAASTAPATAAMSSPGTAGAVKVRPGPTTAFPASLLSPALLAAPPLFHFCNCQVAEVGSHKRLWQWLLLWFWKGGQEGGGFLQKEHMPGHAGSPRELPITISAAPQTG